MYSELKVKSMFLWITKLLLFSVSKRNIEQLEINSNAQNIDNTSQQSLNIARFNPADFQDFLKASYSYFLKLKLGKHQALYKRLTISANPLYEWLHR